jgi:succinoglycan biosynthesis transport protein ExoP
MDHEQLTFSDYLSILKRRGWIMVATFVVLFATAVAVAILLPAVYRSTGTILIESPQIPVDLVQATVTSYADERIEVIKQRVLTRENLLRIIAKYKLFADAGPTSTPSDQIDEIRKSIAVELVNANVRPGAKVSGTIAFRVSFESERAEVAQAAANDLVTLFLNENVKVRTDRATQTTEFLTQESEKLKQELSRLDSQIAAYKQEHGKALPENAAVSVAAMQRVESDLRQVERDHASAQEELRAVESERASAVLYQPQAQIQMQSAILSSAATELQRARAELARLNAIYTENHPDVRATKRRLEGLEQTVAAESTSSPASGTPTKAANPAAEAMISKLDTRAVTLRERIKLLSTQQATLRGRLVQMEGELLKSPQVERGLAALARDYQGAQRKFEEINAKKMTAQVSESLEGDQKAERFTILEPPVLPDRPVKPDRRKVIALGFFLACAGAAGIVILLETLLGTIRGVEAISAIVGMRPLVIVPVIPVAAEEGQRRRLYIQLAAGLSLTVGAALAAVHFLYLPLDLLLMKIILRLS